MRAKKYPAAQYVPLVEELYTERYNLEQRVSKKEEQNAGFPEFIVSTYKKKFKNAQTARQKLMDLAVSTAHHRGSLPQADTFHNFLSEE